MNRRSLFVSLLVLLFISSYAWRATLHGKSISTIPDLLKEARRNGVTNRAGSNLEISKHSIMRLHNGQLDITHNIGNGNNNLALGKISNYSTAMQQDNGLIAAMAETKFGENKILVASSKTMYDTNASIPGRNWFYDIYFVSVKKDITEKVSQSRFGAWRYPNSSKSGYLKDIKTGMFVENFNGELVVAATMEATNDNPSMSIPYSLKKVNARLDFWHCSLMTPVMCNTARLTTLRKHRAIMTLHRYPA